MANKKYFHISFSFGVFFLFLPVEVNKPDADECADDHGQNQSPGGGDKQAQQPVDSGGKDHQQKQAEVFADAGDYQAEKHSVQGDAEAVGHICGQGVGHQCAGAGAQRGAEHDGEIYAQQAGGAFVLRGAEHIHAHIAQMEGAQP